MADSQHLLLDLIAGRWRSQAIYAGTKLNVFEVLRREPLSAGTVATELRLDPEMTYRLLRALGSIGVLTEHADRSFSVTDTGEFLRSDHPQSVRDVVLLREGPEHTAVWKHLPTIVRDGHQNGFSREYGCSPFEYAAREPSYAQAFDAGMDSYSRMQTEWTLDALRESGIDGSSYLCDIGGGHGHLLCHLLVRYPRLCGSVLERPSVLGDREALWADRLNVGDRCKYIGGDMFADVPVADAYILKMILHNWSDTDCIHMLGNIKQRALPASRLFVVEHVVPGPRTPHFAKLFDLHMMTWGTGRERTEEEYADLLTRSGWNYVATRYPARGDIGVVEGAVSAQSGPNAV